MTQEISRSSLKGRKGFLSIGEGFRFFISNKPLLFSTIFIVLITFLVSMIAQSWVGTIISDRGLFFWNQPLLSAWYSYFAWVAWWLVYGVYVIVARILAFYISFMVAYTCSAPFYSILSTMTEKRFNGFSIDENEPLFSAKLLTDIVEALKLTLMVFLLAVVAFFLNWIPLFGQLLSFVLFIFMNALIFVDYAASRRRWTLGRKFDWLVRNKGLSVRIGLIPTAASMIPFFNIFLMVFLFPFFTVYGTLNFLLVEED